MKAIFKALCAAALVGLGMLPAHAQDKTIEMGTLSWEDLTPITGITKKVLEDAGYTVNVTEFSEWGIAYAALSKGDIQVLASQIDYAAQDYWSKNNRRLEKISPVSHGLYQAIEPDVQGRYHSAVLPGFWLDPDWFRQDPLPDAEDLLFEMAPDAYWAWLLAKRQARGAATETP